MAASYAIFATWLAVWITINGLRYMGLFYRFGKSMVLGDNYGRRWEVVYELHGYKVLRLGDRYKLFRTELVLESGSYGEVMYAVTELEAEGHVWGVHILRWSVGGVCALLVLLGLWLIR